MIERQRILLSFIERADEVPTKTHLMKWLFLLSQEVPEATASSFYEFVPYRYGPFSFQAYRELAALEKSGLLESGELRIPREARVKARAKLERLPARATLGIDLVLQLYGNLSRDNLIESVYTRYPWYASRSELRAVEQEKPARLAVYTVGYEGRTIDGLLDHLLRSGIQRLIDVRKNAISRKYGFSGKTIVRLCGNVGVEYEHLSELGIPSSLRSDLTSDAAYEKLFDHYERAIMSNAEPEVSRAARLCLQKPSALMCFEAAPSRCHRGRLAPHVASLSKLEVQHL